MKVFESLNWIPHDTFGSPLHCNRESKPVGCVAVDWYDWV